MTSRPFYESDIDRSNEAAAIAVLADLYECSYRKLPISYGLDYALVRPDNSLLAIAEVKCRSNSSQTYPTIFVSALKRMKALELRRALNIPTLFVPVYTDGIFLIDFKEKPDSVTIGGRKDRGDKADIEPMIHYRTERLARAGFVDLISVAA